MSIYYQHIGERLWARDAPRSIGQSIGGVRRFTYYDVEPFLRHLPAFEAMQLESRLEEFAPTGFQIWGLPSGAAPVLSKMVPGDFLMLLESTDFRYVGQIVHRLSAECRELSAHIWNEQSFPLIVFLQGEMVSFEWSAFLTEFGFASNYHMRGNTARLADQRVSTSPSGSEERFISKVLTTVGVSVPDMETDFRAFADNLTQHFALVKRREAQVRFRTEVMMAYGRKCAVCDIDLPEVLEAAHIVPKQDKGTDDHRNGIVLCCLHHRMFDTYIFGIEPSNLQIMLRDNLTFEATNITVTDIRSLGKRPPFEAIEWRWKKWKEKNQLRD